VGLGGERPFTSLRLNCGYQAHYRLAWRGWVYIFFCVVRGGRGVEAAGSG